MCPDAMSLHLHYKMDTMRGIDAIRKAEAVSKAGGDFSLCFYPYSRKANPQPEKTQLVTREHCTMRRPLPHEKWEVDGKNYFLFSNADGQPRVCHRTLIRYMSFSCDGYKTHKINWYNHEG